MNRSSRREAQQRRHFGLASVLSVGLLIAATAHAQTVKVVGIGATSCREYLSKMESNPQAERDYIAWVQGYMSGFLIRAPAGKDEELDLLPPTFPLLKQADFLRSFCTGNTGADFSDGVNTLYRTLRAPSG